MVENTKDGALFVKRIKHVSLTYLITLNRALEKASHSILPALLGLGHFNRDEGSTAGVHDDEALSLYSPQDGEGYPLLLSQDL
jgi:hypothetical protein